MNKEVKLSDAVAEFANFVREVTKQHSISGETIVECDKASQDLLHQLELGEYRDRGKTATKLSHVRKERRKYKDYIEIVEPLMKLCQTPEGRYFMRQLNEVLGAMRKAEKLHKNRFYIPRVITDIGIAKANNDKNS